MDTWLFKKRNYCPLCRKVVDLDNYDKDSWDVIDVNKDEYVLNTNMEFYNLFHKLFLKEEDK